jgi:ATP-binding cassette subfamily B protein
VARLGAPGRLEYALRLVWESSPWWSIASAVSVLSQAGLTLASLALLKWVVDAITAALAQPDVAGRFEHVGILIALTAAVAMLSAACRSIDGAIAEILRDRVGDHLQGLVHAKSGAVDLEYCENARFRDSLHRIHFEASSRAANMLNLLVQAARSTLMLIAVASLLFAYKWWIPLILVVGDVPGVVATIRGAFVRFRWMRDRTSMERQARYYGFLPGMRHVMQEIRVFGLAGHFIERFRTLRNRLRIEREALIRRRVSFEILGHAFAAVAMFIAFAAVARDALNGGVTLGDTVMYFAAFQRGTGHLNDLLLGSARFYENSLFLAELAEFLALEPKVKDPAQPRRLPRPLKSGIQVDGITFTYPGRDRPSLRDVSLRARPGECIAIVGANGSGKSTLVKLLCRLYDPDEGRISVDGISLRELSRADWWRMLSVFFQDHGRYDLSARENIALGDVDGAHEQATIANAARRSGADEVIERLPRGYDTVLGTFLERSAQLSLGEWQKLALARVGLRDATIRILDEPTNALDVLSEKLVMENMWAAAIDQVTILISHRLSAVRLADRIYVLSEGRVAEQGSHLELMHRRGIYASLFSAQARQYQ